MLLAGLGLVGLGILAAAMRPQVLTLGVSRDGLSIRGDLRGTGVERPMLDLPRATVDVPLGAPAGAPAGAEER